MSLQTFANLTPAHAVDMVEHALGTPVESFVRPCTSHINRVYEMNTRDGLAFIAKFYRPGRWTEAAIRDEHDFMLDCQDAEIPVVAPAAMADGDTLAQQDGIFFAVFPKMGGFPFDSTFPAQWQRLGSLLGRVHAVGEQAEARHRCILHPARTSVDDFNYLQESEAIPLDSRFQFLDIAEHVIDACIRAFPDDVELIRIHGDCHNLNILDRPDEGLHLIDFDDMVVGPPVQDLWMLLPDEPSQCRPLINAQFPDRGNIIYTFLREAQTGLLRFPLFRGSISPDYRFGHLPELLLSLGVHFVVRTLPEQLHTCLRNILRLRFGI